MRIPADPSAGDATYWPQKWYTTDPESVSNHPTVQAPL